jgi:hypothetical protein
MQMNDLPKIDRSTLSWRAQRTADARARSAKQNLKQVQGVNMIFKMTSTQKAPLIVNPVDSKGNSREVESLTFFTSDLTIATIEVDEQAKPWVVATGVKGQVEVSATADRLVGEGVENITESFTLAISDPLATSLGFGIGEPVEKS